MKRFFIALTVAVLLLLTACTGNSGTERENEPFTASPYETAVATVAAEENTPSPQAIYSTATDAENTDCTQGDTANTPSTPKSTAAPLPTAKGTARPTVTPDNSGAFISEEDLF